MAYTIKIFEPTRKQIITKRIVVTLMTIFFPITFVFVAFYLIWYIANDIYEGIFTK